MARGNQREKSREANLKAQGNIVSSLRNVVVYSEMTLLTLQQKNKNTKTGPQQAADKANVAAIMQAKQAAGEWPVSSMRPQNFH